MGFAIQNNIFHIFFKLIKKMIIFFIFLFIYFFFGEVRTEKPNTIYLLRTEYG